MYLVLIIFVRRNNKKHGHKIVAVFISMFFCAQFRHKSPNASAIRLDRNAGHIRTGNLQLNDSNGRDRLHLVHKLWLSIVSVHNNDGDLCRLLCAQYVTINIAQHRVLIKWYFVGAFFSALTSVSSRCHRNRPIVTSVYIQTTNCVRVVRIFATMYVRIRWTGARTLCRCALVWFDFANHSASLTGAMGWANMLLLHRYCSSAPLRLHAYARICNCGRRLRFAM